MINDKTYAALPARHHAASGAEILKSPRHLVATKALRTCHLSGGSRENTALESRNDGVMKWWIDQDIMVRVPKPRTALDNARLSEQRRMLGDRNDCDAEDGVTKKGRQTLQRTKQGFFRNPHACMQHETCTKSYD